MQVLCNIKLFEKTSTQTAKDGDSKRNIPALISVINDCKLVFIFLLLLGLEGIKPT